MQSSTVSPAAVVSVRSALARRAKTWHHYAVGLLYSVRTRDLLKILTAGFGQFGQHLIAAKIRVDAWAQMEQEGRTFGAVKRIDYGATARPPEPVDQKQNGQCPSPAKTSALYHIGDNKVSKDWGPVVKPALIGATLFEDGDADEEWESELDNQGDEPRLVAALLQEDIPAVVGKIHDDATCDCDEPFCHCNDERDGAAQLLDNEWLKAKTAKWPSTPERDTCLRLQQEDKMIARIVSALGELQPKLLQSEFPSERDWPAYVRIFGLSSQQFVLRQDLLFVRHEDDTIKNSLRNESTQPEAADRLVVPPAMRERFLYYAHNKSGHWGTEKVLAQLRDCVYWPLMEEDVANWLLACAKCSLFKPRCIPAVELGTRPPPDGPWSRVHIECTARLSRTTKGHVIILIIVDYFSKMLLARPLKSKAMAEVVPALFEAVSNSGRWPDAICSDKGKEFDNHEMRAQCDTYNVKFHMTSGYHPQSNGQAEKGVASFKQMLKTLVDVRAGDWHLYIPELQVLYNGGINATTGVAPCTLATGSNPRSPARIAMQRWAGILPKTLTRSPDDFVTHMQTVRYRVYRKLVKAVNQTMDRLAPAQKRVQFEVGQRMKRRLHFPTTSDLYATALPRSLDARWAGPYEILHVLQPAGVSYAIKRLRDNMRMVEHHSKLAPYFSAYDPATRTVAEEPYELPSVEHITLKPSPLECAKYALNPVVDPESSEDEGGLVNVPRSLPYDLQRRLVMPASTHKPGVELAPVQKRRNHADGCASDRDVPTNHTGSSQR